MVNPQGECLLTRLPPPLRLRGAHFSLEELEPGRSYHTKQTPVVEKEAILSIGGWDETFRSRVHSELFLRLNPACSIVGLPIVTYQLYSHEGERVSRNSALRQESFERLIEKHQKILQSHPKAYASLAYDHALISYRSGYKRAALVHLYSAMQLAPIRTLRSIVLPLQAKLKR